MARPSKYPGEFRQQAAALVLDIGRTIRDVGRELGVNHETLRNWVQKARAEGATLTRALSSRMRGPSWCGCGVAPPSWSSRRS